MYKPRVAMLNPVFGLMTYVILIVAASQTSVCQEWNPAKHFWETNIHKDDIVDQDGVKLLQVYNLPAKPKSSGLYRFDSLSNSSLPHAVDLPVTGIRSAKDLNGNGVDEVVGGDSENPSRLRFVSDIMSPNEKDHGLTGPTGPYTGLTSVIHTVRDVDGDGHLDVLYFDGTNCTISYGDVDTPFSTRSQMMVQANLTGDKNLRDVLIMFGMLNGKPMALRWVYYGPENNIRTKYQVLALREQDVASRRDTVRVDVVQEIEPEIEAAYRSPVFYSDNDWWIGSSKQNNTKLLHITTSSAGEETPDESYNADGPGNLFDPWVYGQHRVIGQAYVAIDMSRPFLMGRIEAVADSFEYVVEYSKITDPKTLKRASIGNGRLFQGNIDEMTVYEASVLSDLDNDGLEDFMVNYDVLHPERLVMTDASSVFLTSSLKTNVSELIPKESVVDTFQASRRDGYWEVDMYGSCGRANQALIYNVEGAQVSTLSVVREGPLTRIYGSTSILSGPAWAVIGSCSIRLQ